MSMQTMESIVDTLFPEHQPVRWNRDNDAEFVSFTLEELIAACNKLKLNKAPGPGNIPPEILKNVTQHCPNLVLSVYNELARKTTFPDIWKRSKLVLLRKGDKPLQNPASYRPICLLGVSCLNS